jgi:hypothetical protein
MLATIDRDHQPPAPGGWPHSRGISGEISREDGEWSLSIGDLEAGIVVAANLQESLTFAFESR